jgi:hypothetical protein
MSALFITSYVVLWVLVLLLLVAIVAIYHYFGSMILQAEQAQRSSNTPQYGELGITRSHLFTVSGDRINLVGRETPVLLLFLSTTCRTCDQLLNHLHDGRVDPSLSVVVVCGGAEKDDVVRWVGSTAGFEFVFDHRQEIAAELGISVYPFAVGLDKHGIARLTGPVHNSDELRQIVDLVKRTDTPASDAAGQEREVNRVDTNPDGRSIKDEPQPVR